MKSYLKVLILLQLLGSTSLQSQPVDPLNVSVIPPAPTAAALAKYALTPVSLSSGIPNIDIPLYEIAERDISLMVSLSYHGGGIKVGQIASWTGLGWSLNAGGVVTRTVMGLPDEKPISGFIHNESSIAEFLSYSPVQRHEYLQSIADHHIDVQPDEFFFNFAGYAGRFVIEGVDPDGFLIIHTIPYQNFKIIAEQQPTYIKIITPDGMAYNFNSIELTRATTVCEGGGDEQIDESIKSSWYLESITGVNGTVITFDYADGTILYYTTTSESRLEDPWLYCTDHDTECNTEIEIALKRLQSINFSNGTVRFFAETEREDAEYDYALSRIEVVNKQEEIIRSYHFQYDYHPVEPINCNDRECKRLMLISITEEGMDGAQLPPYQFEYDPTPLPSRNSKAQDHWGFYNGALSNQTLVPAYPEEECESLNGAADGANRLPNFSFAKAAVLTGLLYPSGGTASYTYEENRFGRYQDQLGVDTFEANEIPRIDLSAFASSNGVNSTKPADTFVVNADQIVRISTSIEFGNPPCECEASVRLINSNGQILFERGDEDAYENCLFLPAGTYYLTSEMTGSGPTAHATITTYYYELQNDTIKSVLTGGLRIKEVRLRKDTVNSSDDQVVRYSYNMAADKDRSSGFLLSTILYDYGFTTRGFSEVGGPGTTCDFQVRTSVSQVPVSTANGNPVFYPEVTEFFGDMLPNGNAAFGKRESTFSFSPDIGVLTYPFAPPVNYGYKRGLLLEVKEYNSDNQLKLETSNKYEFDAINHAHGITGLKVAYLKNDQQFDGMEADEFTFSFYFYHSQWVHQSEQTTTEYFQDGSRFETKRQLFHDNPAHAQPTRIITTRSDGNTEVTVRRFPLDYDVSVYGGADAMLIGLDTMINKKFMVNTLVEEYTLLLKSKNNIKPTGLNNNIANGGEILSGGIISTGNSAGFGSEALKGKVEIDTFIVAGRLVRYRVDGSYLVPDTVFVLDLGEPVLKSSFTASKVYNNSFIHDNRYRCTRKFDAFNEHAQPEQYHEPYGMITSVIYQGNTGMVSAVFNNTAIADVAYTGFESEEQGGFTYQESNVDSEGPFSATGKTITGSRYFKPGTVSRVVSSAGKYILSYWATTAVNVSGSACSVTNTVMGETINGFTLYQVFLNFSSSGTVTLNSAGLLDELRLYPEAAWATSYSYQPLAGISEVCDANNYITRYEYDAFNRLQYTEDHFGNGLNFTEYQLRSPGNATNQNYIRYETAVLPGITRQAFETGTLQNIQSKRVITYLDGIGREMQQVEVSQSPSGKDIVNFLEYDAFGRQPRSYLPYSTEVLPGEYKISAIADQHIFYATGTDWEFTDFAYDEKTFEDAPSGKVTRDAFAGEVWKASNHNVHYNYRSNYANEVRLFKFDPATTGWKSVNYYSMGTLQVVETTDENDNTHLVYLDNKGRTVLEKHPRKLASGEEVKQFEYIHTYYVYDDLGRLAVVISPEGYNQLLTGTSFTVKATGDVWNFFYRYNNRGLISAGKLPGIDWSYYIYDQLNRPVLTQDPNLRVTGKWSYSKFDQFGRPVSSGITAIAGQGAEQLQDQLWMPAVTCSETRSESANGYTNVVFPTESLEELAINYYDDYDFNSDGTPDYATTNADNARSKEKLTGQFSKILEEGPAVFEKGVFFYDYKSRVIETKGTNHDGGEETTWLTYNFEGLPLEQIRIHQYSYAPPGGGLGFTTELTRKLRYEYDFAGRLKNTWLQVDEQPEIWINSLGYNELGKVKKQRLHNVLVSSGTIPIQKSMQTIDYRYNIRGWLIGINDLSQVSKNGDFWAAEMHYTDGHELLDATAQYSGNIAWMAWKSCRDERTRMYGYEYDPLNRLVKSKYGTAAGPGITESGQYTVDNLTYDDNGNIKSMWVNGALAYDEETKLHSYGITDQLTYQYEGNRLLSVTDAIALVPWNGSNDFNDVSNATDYSYDVNGSMTADANKSVSITYNHLNLPSLISKSTDQVKVIYGADGAKLKEETTENLQVSTTGYFGDIIHEEGKPARILFDGGYLQIDTSGKWIPYYFIKDHLGNTRVVFKGENLNWQQGELTFEINEDEEGDAFPGFRQVSAVRNNEMALQGESSGKLYNQEGPYTEIPVFSGDTVQVSVYYYYEELDPQKTMPPVNIRQTPQAAELSFELKPLPLHPAQNDLANIPGNRVYGLQLNIAGLFENLMHKKRNAAPEIPNDFFDGAPQAYLELSLRDTADQEINNWRMLVDTANNWNRLTDSIGIHVPDTSQQYTLRVSLHNESERTVWFDTLHVNLGQKADPVVQVNHYYPFGNLIADISWQAENADTNNYLYNGKELHRSLNLNWLDYGARWYDPQVGRWWVVDPMAEAYVSWSPYNYVLNNPIIGIDPNGMFFLDSKERVAAREKAKRLDGNYEKIGYRSFKVNYGYDSYDQEFNTSSLGTTFDIISPGEGSNTSELEDELKRSAPMIVVPGSMNGPQNAHDGIQEVGIITDVAIAIATLGVGPLIKAGISGASKEVIEGIAAKGGLQATESVITGFTGHATNQAITRGFKSADIIKIVREGTAVKAAGRYGSQIRYTLGGNTVVVNAQGKVVTLFSSAQGTANGFGKGFFIPIK
jgi:RHS repeat-associated protein